MVLPPDCFGGLQLTIALAFPADAETLDGASEFIWLFEGDDAQFIEIVTFDNDGGTWKYSGDELHPLYDA